ncbi:coiled-coil domain-containing protein 96 [Solea senegalensis]|uniref:Coiled-coil domain-containing protein 96 n=1 Tax=Solea senegalensis TaxID=28829 RepID=A0AAV6R0R7_SOLSE|nr:coiled-coil domain-containing protein 96-like [Solea senegalensis]KAG7497552.1 coiled-coil domain-containing protein 96 [Solea senegalensis]
MEGEKKDTERETISEDASNRKDTSLIPDIGNEKDEENEVKNDTEKKETSEDSSMKDTSLIPDIGNEKDEENEVKKETSEAPSMKDTSLILDKGRAKDEENEVKIDTQRETKEESSNMKDSSLNPEEEEEEITAEVGASHHEVSENSESVKVPGVAPTSERAESSRDDVPSVDDITTGQELDEEDREQPVSHEEGSDRDGPARLHPESPAQVEAEEDKSSATAEDVTYEETRQLHQELCKEREKSSQLNSQLQVKLADYLHRKARDDPPPERETPVSEQLQEYERHVNVLGEVKQQLAADAETIRQKTEELRLLSQENLDKAESEWQAFMTLKQQVTVATLSRRLGKQEAQTKVESTLAAERLRQDELVKQRLRHIKLKAKIHRLEAELRDVEEHGRDPLQLQYEQLQAARLEQKKQAEKQSEESMKLQAKISSGLEVLTNVKEKLFWTQRDVQAKREQLAEVEAMVARKRDVLTRMKQARNRLQRDNQRLKERRGLLGNKVLLRDFEDTVDASDVLRERLEMLKCRQTEIVLGCARWKKLETNP